MGHASIQCQVEEEDPAEEKGQSQTWRRETKSVGGGSEGRTKGVSCKDGDGLTVPAAVEMLE